MTASAVRHTEKAYTDMGRQNTEGQIRMRPVSDSQAFLKTPKHPWESRKSLSEDYEAPVSSREGWWRCYIRETPKPGSYDWSTFVDDLVLRPNTYRFKSDGRKRDPQPHGKGTTLMPGAYEYQDFLHGSLRKQATYSFKAVPRDAFDVLNFGKKDKDINVSPTAYGTERYMAMSVEKMPSKHFMFKSQDRRFPTAHFKPKLGPGPGNYEYSPPPSQHTVSSSFRSKTPRFSSSHTKVPGPGAYEKTFQYPMKPTVAKMGRQHGLFFSSAFQA